MGESRSATGKPGGGKREAGKSDAGHTKRAKPTPVSSAYPVPDRKRLEKLSTEELVSLIADIVEVLKGRAVKDTEKIASPLAELSFPDDAGGVEVEDFLRLPVGFKKDPADVADRIWRVALIGAGKEQKSLGLELCDDTVVGRHYPGEAEPDLDLKEFDAEALGVSRQHAMLHPMPEGLFLADLGSTNGTYWNGDRVKLDEPQQLNDDDAISFGELHFKVRIVRRPESKSAD